MSRHNKVAPIVALALISPTIAELLSGNLDWPTFFSPTLLFLVALYGSGALLIRELKTKWRRGIPCLLLLGVAYGIAEEGLVFSVFFADAEQLILVYHAVFSITIPVLLTESLAGKLSISEDEPWLNDSGLILCSAIFVGAIALGIAFSDFSSLVSKLFFQYPLSMFLIFIFILLARGVPPGLAGKGKAVGNPTLFFFVGLAWSGLFFLLPFLIHTMISIFVELSLTAMFAFFIAHHDWKKNSHRLSLMCGLLSFFLLPLFLNFLNTH